MRRRWTDDEVEYLQNVWGISAITTISKTLSRSVTSIKMKAYSIGLGRHIHSGDYITYNQFLTTINNGNGGSYKRTQLINNGIPIKYKKSINRAYQVIYLEDFWKWAEKNRKLLDFSKIEKGIFGKEPEWVKDVRKADEMASKFKKTEWTSYEDSLLISLLNTYRYGYKEISQRLMRTEGAIKRRVFDLGIKQRPLKAYNHNKWKQEEIDIVIDMHKRGYSAELIAERLPDRSASAVRGILERLFL